MAAHCRWLLRDNVVNVEPLERLRCLERVPLFSGLSTPRLSVLAQSVEERFFAKNAVLMHAGEPVKEVHFVVEGRVGLRRAGAPQVVLAGSEGTGLLGLLGRVDADRDALALSETLTLSLDSATLVDILEDDFAILHHLIRSLCGLLAEAHALALEQQPPADLHAFGEELDLVARIFALRPALPFARDNIPLLSTLARLASDVRSADREPLWARGAADRCLLVVARGSVACTTDAGDTLTFGPASCLGAFEAIAGLPRSYAARADGPLLGLRFDAEHLIDVFEDDTEAGMAFMSVLARQLQAGAASPGDAARGAG
jgi:CRP-like cAMP-binding protein